MKIDLTARRAAVRTSCLVRGLLALTCGVTLTFAGPTASAQGAAQTRCTWHGNVIPGASPADAAVIMQCPGLDLSQFASSTCPPEQDHCFDAIVSIETQADARRTTTTAVDNRKAVATGAVSSKVVDYRQDRACKLVGNTVECRFSKFAMADAIGFAIPKGSTISGQESVLVRMAGPHCGGGAPCAGTASPSTVQTLGPAMWLLDRALLATIALTAQTTSALKDCLAGQETTCKQLMESPPRPDVRDAAQKQLGELRSKACAGGDAQACSDAADLLDGPGDVHARCTAMRVKGCDGSIAHACFLLGSGMMTDPVKAAALIEKACDGGEGQACLALATRFESGLGVPKDPRQAQALYRQACDTGIAGGCVEAGQGARACELGDQPSCDTLCKTGDMIACKGASPDVRAEREAHHAKQDAEAAIPRLLAKCASDRATILHLKGALSAAQGAHDDAKAQSIQDKLDQMRDPWGELKADLESAITTATRGSGPRFESLRQQARQACAGHD